MIGSFGGALLGGIVAYKSTVRANNFLLRRKKLEESLGIATQLEQEDISGAAAIKICLKANDIVKNHDVLQSYSAKINTVNVIRLRTLLQIYHEESYEKANNLNTKLIALKVRTRKITSKTSLDEAEGLSALAMECVILIFEIKKSLMKELKI
ncbi:MAG: hypothetical protein CMK92_02125 [Pseudomonas sp.]|nr:hypothetical protein [Pseudomonas sp.]